MLTQRHKVTVPNDGSEANLPSPSVEGFTLIEMLIAIVILTFGLLAAGQLLLLAMSSASLARSKGSAAVVAQNRLELLADLYRQNTAAADLTNGSHGPVVQQIVNPNNSNVLNRYNVAWTVSDVSDPRVGKTLNAKHVTVTVTPINSAGTVHKKTGLNKVVSVSSIFSVRTE